MAKPVLRRLNALPRAERQRAKEAILEFVAILAAWDQAETNCRLDVPADPIHPPREIGETS